MLELKNSFAVIDSGLGLTPVAVGPTMYADLERNFAQFKQCILVSEHNFDRDWATWEVHPAGDELLYLLDGQVRLILRCAGEDQVIDLTQPGTWAAVPKGTWHTAKVAKFARLLFITPGEGTENATEPPKIADMSVAAPSDM
jgi:mannose-6-phosphate isomerase-like protein (cupin superfamily)